jgi:hypothetical protein
VLAVTGLAIIAATATSAFARGGCAADPSAGTPFAAWGDTNSYVLAPGGGARLDDGESLTTSCVKVIGAQPIVRFFAKTSNSGSNDGNRPAALHVELLIPGSSLLVLDGGLVTATNTLAPLAQVVLQYEFKNGATPLQVRLTAQGGGFNIGDVYIDPYVQRSADL